jgi:GNAT superfamily N-acetyltransferase
MTTPQPVGIRPAGAADADALARLRYEFRAALERPAESGRAFLDRCTSWMRDRLADGAWRAWVAEERGEIVGTVWLAFFDKLPNPVEERERHAYITNLYVRPDRRSGGLGARLLDHALRECEARQADAVLLWPTERSRTLYARHGFRAADDLMERRLAEPPSRTRGT